MLVVVRMTVSTVRYNALHDFALKRIMNHDVCRDSILSFVALQCCLISLARDIGCSAGVANLQYLTQTFLESTEYQHSALLPGYRRHQFVVSCNGWPICFQPRCTCCRCKRFAASRSGACCAAPLSASTRTSSSTPRSSRSRNRAATETAPGAAAHRGSMSTRSA